MLRNKIQLKPYECHMISDKVLFLRQNSFIGKASGLLLMLFLFVVTKLHAQNPVASFTVPSSQGCVPYNLQFTNTSQNAVTYQWDFGNGNTSTLANPSNVFTNAGTYTVTLTVFGSTGNSNSFSLQIVVQPKPVANFSVDLYSGCQNSQIFSFTNLSANFDSCNWDFGDGTTSNLFNPLHTYLIPGTFNVTLVVYNRQYGCSDLKIITSMITVHPSPTAVLTVNDTATCDKNFNFQFTGSLLNANSWFWNFDDGVTSNLLNPNHIYGDTGLFKVSIVMTSSNGCIDTFFMPHALHVKWNPEPPVSISDDSGCMPHYVALLTTYYSNASYSWNLGNGITRSGFGVYYTYPDSGVFPVNLHVTYENGCQQTKSAGPIVVHEIPQFTYWMSNFLGCAPLSVQFINNSNNLSYSWLWDFGDGNTSNLFAPNYTYTSHGSYQVSLTATSVNGCSKGYPLSQKVNVFSPTALFSPDVTSGCPPLEVNFNNQSINATAWYWDFGDGTTSLQQHPTHIYAIAGSYQVRLIVSDATGCSDTLLYPVLINVSQSVVNYVVPPDIVGCAPYSVNFSDASGASSFLWDFGDGTTSTLSNPYHVFTEPGTYIVSLTTWMANGGCEQHIPNFQTFIIDGAYPGFTYSVSPCPPYQVYFNDTSLNASQWHWSFGDGGSATVQHPTHTFPGPGTYNVALTVTTPSGCVTTLQANNSVQITGLGASASAITLDTVPPLNVQFYANSSAATSWIWSFGDGDSSFLENPTHVYSSLGPFTITLTIANDSCVYTYTYPPIKFGSSFGQGGGGLGGPPPPPPPREYHCAPYTVLFSNPDPAAISILWDFGDGFTSTLSAPEHAYVDSGAFIPVVYLTYSNGTVDSIVYSDTIFVVEPISDFDITTTNLCNGVIVNVQSPAPAVNYNWNFGNGVTFNSPLATFTYPLVNASYMVSLNVVDTNNCSSFVAKSFSVNATSPLTSNKRRACAGDSIQFDPGNVNYSLYSWDFGDGSFSSLKNPVHAYQDSGIFIASLLVTDVNGCQLTYNMSYSIQVFKPEADFVISSITTNCLNVNVLFSDTSTGNSSIKWFFGDGTSSNQSSVFHSYSTPGIYDVTLIAYNNVCSDTMVLPAAVTVGELEPMFSYTVINDCSPAVVHFTDLSVDAVSWHWDFGDSDTSSSQNPVHTYNTNPLDSVTLTVKDIYGCTKSIALPAPQITKAGFNIGVKEGCVPFNVAFNDSSSNAISWEWDFGDGTTSNQTSPFHTYLADGYYSVSLIVTSSSGCRDTLILDSLIEVNTPVANFSVDQVIGCAPLLVNFTDLSLNAIKWTWDFGNSGTSGNQHPSLIYVSPGVYSVNLSIENKFGCTAVVGFDSIIRVQGAIPSFNVSAITGCAPLNVSFTNTSVGSISWDWHFGDGTIDSVCNPNHVYQNAGTFSVTLFAFDSAGCSSVFTYPATVDVGTVPVLDFTLDVIEGCSPLTVSVTDTATLADSLVWDMGDGSILTGRNPIHTYQNAGSYLITLIAFNADGCSDTLQYPDTIKVFPEPNAQFSADILEGCSPVQVSFTNSSTGLSNPLYEWDFGNGDASALSDPQYTYTMQGVYTITLIVTNDNGCIDTMIQTDYIDVFDQNPPPVTDLYRVTVNSSDIVYLEWQKTMVNDLDYYVVYRMNPMNAAFDSIGQVFQTNTGINGNIPFYNDSNLATTALSYSYKVQAVDKCGLRQDLSALRAHETILLSTVGTHQQVSLTWNPYGGCSVSGYEIYRADDNNGVFQLVATVDSSVYVYVDSSAGCPIPYTYKVIGLNICGDPLYQSASNESTATPTSDIEDQFVDVVRSTVVDDQFVLTEWGEPSILPALVDRFDIYRSTDKVNYQLIASVPRTAHEYSDFDVAVQYQDYYYKIIVQNICNVEGKEGFIGSSILLQRLEMGADYILKWTKYQHWNSGVETYVIEKLNGNGSWEEIDRLPGTVTEWEEK